MRVRNATTDDIEIILALNTFVQRQHAEAIPRLFKVPTDSQQAIEAFRATLEDSNSLVLLAEDTEPAGYLYAEFQHRPASWKRLELRLLYIHHMAVAPNFQRHGAGTLLILAALDAARSKGIERVELDVWSFNSEAKHFYAKHGFEVFNERMQLPINAD